MDKKPIFLFADSQLLFYKSDSRLFLENIKSVFSNKDNLKAAYIGASNDDNSIFFDIFKQAINQISIKACEMIRSDATQQQTDYLRDADIILLAGGDTEVGWNVIKNNGWDVIIRDKYDTGSVLIGISAGAIQLGTKGFKLKDTNIGSEEWLDTLNLVPFIIDVHAEDDWDELSKRVALENGKINGYGIPFGAGIVYYPNGNLEVIRYSCISISYTEKGVLKSNIKSTAH